MQRKTPDVLRGLGSVPHLSDMYHRQGYTVKCHAFTLYQGKPTWTNLVPSSSKVSIQHLKEEDLDNVLHYDQSLHPFKREEYVKKSLMHDKETAFVAKKGEQMVGFGAYHLTGTKYKVAPWYADTAGIAEALLRRLMEMAHKQGNNEVFVESMAHNACSSIMKKCDLQEVCQLQIQFTKKPFHIDIDKVFSPFPLDVFCI